MTNRPFSSLSIKSELLENLESLEFTSMTPIQSEALPIILQGKDLIAQGKTGSGKTVAFGLALIERLNVKNLRPQALVLCPTRELANQVAIVLRQLARMSPNVKVLNICGGLPFRPQELSLSHGTHIVVGTPGRICKHLRKNNLNLTDLRTLVLDEGDRMLEMGFQEDIDMVVDCSPKNRQTLLFSATFPDRINSMIDGIMSNPQKIEVDSNSVNDAIEQHFYKIGSEKSRMGILKQLLLKHPESTVVFCNTKAEVMDVTDELIDSGFSALDIHGDLEQRDREETLIKFTNRSITILVATDVAARGLDVSSIEAVVNYRIGKDLKAHVHRVGRTGRAGEKGMAYTLFSEKESYKLRQLEEFLEAEIEVETIELSKSTGTPVKAPMVTLFTKVGKKQKLRPGNLLGALTGENGLDGKDIGKINVQDHVSYIAVKREQEEKAIDTLISQKWKSRPIKAVRI